MPNTFKILINVFLVLFTTSITTAILTPKIWRENTALIHSILELFCVFISLSIFVVIWYTFENITINNRVIGFSFLSVAAFDVCHIIYYSPLNYAPNDYVDLFARFGVISRLTEAVFLLIGIYGLIKINLNKWIMLTITIASSIAFSLIILNFSDLFPKLFTSQGVTIYRVIIEYLILIVFLFCIYPLLKSVNKREVVTYKYILAAIITGIPVEVFFSLDNDITSFHNVAGHILKIFSYIFLFKGIFISAVTYPYRNKVNELNISEERFKNAFEYAAVGMSIVGLDGKWLKVNNALCQLMGYSSEELLNMTFMDVTHRDDWDMDKENAKKLLDGKIGYYQMEKRYIHKDGYILWVLLNASLVRDEIGEPIYFIAQIHNISELKEAYETIEYDRLRTEFFANISHELRTPLNIISNSIQLFSVYVNEDTMDKERYLKLLNSMRQNCYRLIRLINNLIDTTKIEAGFYNLNVKRCNIINVIEEVTMSVVEFSKSKNIELIFDTEIEEMLMACDPEKIERIMLNLLSNAIKFSRNNGSIFVSISHKGEEIAISVRDNGIGIEKDKLEVIFQRFSQVDKSLNRSHEGSGIGLSIVKSLVELHGGGITVESEYEKGSEFIVLLPTNIKEQEVMEKPLCEINKDSEKLSQSRKEAICIELSDIYFLQNNQN